VAKAPTARASEADRALTPRSAPEYLVDDLVAEDGAAAAVSARITVKPPADQQKIRVGPDARCRNAVMLIRPPGGAGAAGKPRHRPVARGVDRSRRQSGQPRDLVIGGLGHDRVGASRQIRCGV
jgi:hypothetical protein